MAQPEDAGDGSAAGPASTGGLQSELLANITGLVAAVTCRRPQTLHARKL